MLNIQDIDCPAYFLVIEVPWQEVVNSCLYILIVKPIKVSSFEPELNQRPKDVNICNLQSSALPTELSKGHFMFNSVAFFWKMSDPG